MCRNSNLTFFSHENMKKTSSKVGYFRKIAETFITGKKWHSLPRQLKAQIVFSMFLICTWDKSLRKLFCQIILPKYKSWPQVMFRVVSSQAQAVNRSVFLLERTPRLFSTDFMSGSAKMVEKILDHGISQNIKDFNKKTSYRLFFFRLILHFFTQIYMNCFVSS